jgi:hypothetical protein
LKDCNKDWSGAELLQKIIFLKKKYLEARKRHLGLRQLPLKEEGKLNAPFGLPIPSSSRPDTSRAKRDLVRVGSWGFGHSYPRPLEHSGKLFLQTPLFCLQFSLAISLYRRPCNHSLTFIHSLYLHYLT